MGIANRVHELVELPSGRQQQLEPMVKASSGTEKLTTELAGMSRQVPQHLSMRIAKLIPAPFFPFVPFDVPGSQSQLAARSLSCAAGIAG